MKYLYSTILAAGVAAATQAHADTAVLKLKPRVSMETLAQAVSDPASPRYHRFYTPAQIRRIAGPTKAEYASLKQELAAQGISIASESPTHLWLTVNGTTEQLSALAARASAQFASLDFSATRSVESVQGLAPSSRRRPMLKVLPQSADAGFAGNDPATIRKFYGFDKIYASGITGRGQHIAIATYDDLDLNDVNQYYQKNDISPAPAVDKVTFNGTPQVNGGSAMETELDAEFSGMIAPGADIHVFTSAQNSDAGEEQMFTAILDDNRAKIVNYSWGSCDDSVDPKHRSAMQSIWARAVAQGVNVMVASGDSGSSCNGDGQTVADFQASSTFVVAVGGTTIPAGAVGTETAWSGSGGGVSTNYDQPSWQTGTSYTKRAYPDVAYNADPHSGQPLWTHTGNGGDPSYIVVGGTSIAAPQWSGFLALVGEARGSKALGYLNPIVYGLSAADRAGGLRDITSGSNGAYNAGTGFDAVTGMGSPNANTLFDILRASN